MIKSINIKNFETHISTGIDLHEGVNVLIGESDEGKSGIIRSIKWNVQNKPQGDSYRNDKLNTIKDKKKLCRVGINYKGDGLVVRERDNVSTNHYVIDNEEPLRALRTDIPQEVQDLTRMKDFNIQGQHPSDQYFLLADKPGQVAKKFNKVSGLSVIDDTTTETNKQVREINATLKVVKKEIITKEEQLKNLEWVPNAVKQADKLKIDHAKLEKLDYKIQKSELLLEQLDSIENKLERFNGLDKALQDIQTFDALNNTIHSMVNRIESISDTIDGLKTIDTQLNASNGIESALKEIKQLKKLDTEITECTIVFDKINDKLTDIAKNKLDIDKFNESFSKFKKEFNNKIMTEQCPTCGRSGK